MHASWNILTLLSVTYMKAREYWFIPVPGKGHRLEILSRMHSTLLQLCPLLFFWLTLRVRIKGKWSSCGSWPRSARLCHLQTIFRLPLYSRKRLTHLVVMMQKRYSISSGNFKNWILVCYFYTENVAIFAAETGLIWKLGGRKMIKTLMEQLGFFSPISLTVFLKAPKLKDWETY